MGYYSFNPNTGLDMSQLTEFSQALSGLLDDIPEMRRELHQDLADELKRALDVRIGSAINDSHGTIRSWQQPHVGSGGGYAAVRPISGSGPDGNPRHSPGAITAYLEGGHRLRHHEDSKKRYYMRIKVAAVNGRWFYRNTYITFENHAMARAEKFVNQLADKLEGRR